MSAGVQPVASEDKTEKATAKKLKDSRKEGQVARTQELGAWASMLAVALSIADDDRDRDGARSRPC